MPRFYNLRRTKLFSFLLKAGAWIAVWNGAQVLADQAKRESAAPSTVKPASPVPANGAKRNGAENPAANEEPLSDAERIARLQRAIVENERILADQRSKLTDPQDEYAKAEAEFSKLDRDFQEKKRELQKLKDSGTVDPSPIEAEISALEPTWKLAKERFDLAIKARKTLQEQITTLEQKVRQDQEAVRKLTEVKPPPPAPPDSASPSPTPVQDAPGKPPIPVGKEQILPSPVLPAPSQSTEPVAPSAGAQPPRNVGGQTATGGSPAGASALTTAAKSPPSPQLIKAKEVAGQKESEAAEAEQEAKSITERVEALRKSIEQERSLLTNARNRADNSQETEKTLDDDLQRRWAEGAERSELDELRQKKSEARERFREARAEIKERSDRLDTLQSDLGELQGDEIAALRAAEEKRIEAEAARKKVETLQNPFTPGNVLQWLIDHGPRILLVILGMIGIVWVARLLEYRISNWMAHHGKGRASGEDENRAKTLVGVFHNAIRVIVLLGGTLMILAEAGVNIIPLMGGAAVLGLAAAFGGQNLLRDYFTGFMILLENQYAVNDVVRIGDVAGLVERITLRLTVLRDLDGRVHFVPNGHIATVTNMTHGWSRALFDIGVAYKEDVDRVMELLVELGKELRRDPDFRHMILEQPEMLGVDQFGDSAVVIKFFIKTRPLMQWTVRREMLRRIKKKFDELGIEIPFPHRTLYHRYGANDRHLDAAGFTMGESETLHAGQDRNR